MYNWSYIKNNPGIYNITGSNEICLWSEKTETGEILVYEAYIESMHKELANSSKWADDKFTKREETYEVPSV
jgi:hypothetical protein